VHQPDQLQIELLDIFRNVLEFSLQVNIDDQLTFCTIHQIKTISFKVFSIKYLLGNFTYFYKIIISIINVNEPLKQNLFIA